MNIIWSSISQARIRDILDYKARDNSDAALALIDEIENRVNMLGDNPNTGRIVTETKSENIRELVVHQNYGVIYEVHRDVIHILTVRHFRQNFNPSSPGR